MCNRDNAHVFWDPERELFCKQPHDSNRLVPHRVNELWDQRGSLVVEEKQSHSGPPNSSIRLLKSVKKCVKTKCELPSFLAWNCLFGYGPSLISDAKKTCTQP